MSHPDCHTERGHVCQQPSGDQCVEISCHEPAGTLWGPLWCPEHDEKRLDRVMAGLHEVASALQMKEKRSE